MNLQQPFVRGRRRRRRTDEDEDEHEAEDEDDEEDNDDDDHDDNDDDHEEQNHTNDDFLCVAMWKASCCRNKRHSLCEECRVWDSRM